MRYMKQFFSLLLAIISIFYIQNILAESNTKTQNLDQVIAVVNNSIITQSDVDTAFVRAKQQMATMPHQTINDSQLKKLILQQLIDRKLQLMIAKQAKITVSQTQVMQAIQNIAETNHLTVNQFKARIKQSGLSFKDYEKAIHDELLIHHVQESAVGNKVQVTDQDIQRFLSQYKTQWNNTKQYHIVDIHIPIVNIDSKTDVEQAKQAALRIQQQWKKTEKTNSDNVSDLGWQTANTLPALFLDQLAQMKPGDISSPILAPNGFHIIKLIGVQQSNNPPPSQNQIKNMVYQMKFQAEAQKWIQELRKTAYIKIYNTP